MSRINEYTQEDIIKVILDSSNTDLVRATLVEFMYLSSVSQSNNKYSELPESIKDLLYDKHSGDMLKINILYSLDSNKERDYKILEEFSEYDNPNVATVANKIYGKVKKQAAILSGDDNTFTGYNKDSKENVVLREKIFAKARTFNVPEESLDNPSDMAKSRKEFIDKCFDIYDESIDIDIDLKQTCIYAIRDTCDYRGIKEIIQRDNIEKTLKIGYSIIVYVTG